MVRRAPALAATASSARGARPTRPPRSRQAAWAGKNAAGAHRPADRGSRRSGARSASTTSWCLAKVGARRAPRDEVKELAPDWAKRGQRRGARSISAARTSGSSNASSAWRSASRSSGSTPRARSRRSGRRTRQHVDVWGAETPAAGARFGEAAIREVLDNPQSATFRLRTLMDAWCSLWLWAPEHGTELPSLDQWLSAAEALTRIDEPLASRRPVRRRAELPLASSSSLDEILDAHPWLRHARAIAPRRTGFTGSLSSRPSSRAAGSTSRSETRRGCGRRWSDDDALAEHDPWFGITDPIPEKERVARRSTVLERRGGAAQYLRERAENAATRRRARRRDTRAAARRAAEQPLSAVHHRHMAAGIAPTGAIALLHPDGSPQRPEGGAAARGRVPALPRVLPLHQRAQALHRDQPHATVSASTSTAATAATSTSFRPRSSTTRSSSTAASATTARRASRAQARRQASGTCGPTASGSCTSTSETLKAWARSSRTTSGVDPSREVGHVSGGGGR